MPKKYRSWTDLMEQSKQEQELRMPYHKPRPSRTDPVDMAIIEGVTNLLCQRAATHPRFFEVLEVSMATWGYQLLMNKIGNRWVPEVVLDRGAFVKDHEHDAESER